jgi:hypothetical protein
MYLRLVFCRLAYLYVYHINDFSESILKLAAFWVTGILAEGDARTPGNQ